MNVDLIDEPDPFPDKPDYSDQVLAVMESLDLVAEDGEPMESAWHRQCMNLLIDQIDQHHRDRDDFYVGGNMFIYYSPAQVKNKDFRGPDFFYVSDTTREPEREFWAVWNENLRTPDVVIELASESTRDEDRGEKFEIYRDTLRVPNYFIFDRESGELEGWRLERKRYVKLKPDRSGRLFSDELDLFLGAWQGRIARSDTNWVRFFDAQGVLLPTATEFNAERAEAERMRAETEKQRAEAEKQRAESERVRADSAEAEIARLKALLAKHQSGSTNRTSSH